MALSGQLSSTLTLDLALGCFPFLRFFRLFLFALVVLSQVQRKSATGIRSYILANTHQRLTAFVKHVFQTNYNALKVHLAALLDVIAHFSQVDCKLNGRGIIPRAVIGLLERTIVIAHILAINNETHNKDESKIKKPLTVIQRSIHFIHDKERGRVVRMNCKQKCQRSHGLLSPTELIHVPEPFHWRHSIEFHPPLEGLLGVVKSEICVTTQGMFA